MSIALALACTSWGTPGVLLHADRFDGPLTQWVTEYRQAPGSKVEARGGRLVMDVASGATAWFRTPLSGDYLIRFTRKVVMAGGANDRLSDLNMFWMASDPRTAELFTRTGEFEQYDNLRMYYVGVGGNTNTTTRLRRYDGTGARQLLGEYSDRAHLLQPNHRYAVEIAVYRGCTRVRLDGDTLFSFRDPEPLLNGYFGLRTTQSRQEIGDFQIYQLK
ncbi:MAG: DUF6250 domain-containing protein [Gammaproteobacteria bacterium]